MEPKTSPSVNNAEPCSESEGGRVDVSEITRLARLDDFNGALRVVNECLERIPDCPYLLWRRSIVLQLCDDPRVTLEDAETALLSALNTNPTFLQALEGLAHYYDAVVPDVPKAKEYARRYAELAGPILEQMKFIIDQPDDA
jgi:hypothetical protein